MHEAKKRTITKRIVQAVAVAFGLFGLMLVFSGILVAIPAIIESDYSFLIHTDLLFVVGAICLAVAWQNLRHFGPNAIKNVTALVVLTLYVILAPLDRSLELESTGIETSLIEMAIFWISLLLAFLLYRTVSKKLIHITQPQTIQQDPNPDNAPS